MAMGFENMQIVFVRHGESIGNALKGNDAIYTGRWDCDLTERGMQQAEDLIGDPVLENVEVIFVSDLKRAVDTANIISSRTDKIVDPRLAERSLGEFEGRKIIDIENSPQYAKYFNDPSYMNFRKSFTARAPGGENYGDVCNRIRPFLMELAKCRYKKIVIVSHFVVIRCILKEMFGMSEEETLELKVPNCSPICVQWNGRLQ